MLYVVTLSRILVTISSPEMDVILYWLAKSVPFVLWTDFHAYTIIIGIVINIVIVILLLLLFSYYFFIISITIICTHGLINACMHMWNECLCKYQYQARLFHIGDHSRGAATRASLCATCGWPKKCTLVPKSRGKELGKRAWVVGFAE